MNRAMLLFRSLRLAVVLLAPLVFWAALPAQNPPAKPPVKKTTKEEEEEPTKPKPKVIIKVDDDDPKPKPMPPPPKPQPGSATDRAADLAQEARAAKHAELQKLFGELAVPHDLVTMQPSGNVRMVMPVPEYVGNVPKFASLTLTEFDKDKKPGRSYPVSDKAVRSIQPYEQVALERVDTFLKKALDKSPAAADYLPRAQMLLAAEIALATALRFHEKARESGARSGNGWDSVGQQLQSRLLAVQLDHLAALAQQKSWNAARNEAQRLEDAYPSKPEVKRAVMRIQVQSAESIFQDTKEAELASLRPGIDRLEKELSAHKDAEAETLKRSLTSLRDRMQTRAREYIDRAGGLGKKSPAEAVRLLRMAELLWPQVPGLADAYRALGHSRTLYVGVRHLPESPQLSPGTASTDFERQALELLFESLVKPIEDPEVGQRYEPGLAQGRPRLTPMGRQFQLAAGARWSNGEPVTAADVLGTVQLLKDPGWPGRSPEWDDLVQGARVDDPTRVHLTLGRGFVDPLSLMTFKVLPARHLRRMDDRTFAEKPIGSGPYQLQGRTAEQAHVTFQASSGYGSRADKTGLPHIREVRFFESKNPVEEFQRGQLHLLLDFDTQRIKDLQSPDARLGHVHIVTLRNRRIYFLAVNHRRTALKNANLRKGLAFALDREKVLNECFRSPDVKDVHRWLNGPFPRGTWPCAPELDLDAAHPYRPELAKSLAQQTRPGKLTLKYPGDDARVKAACERIRAQAAAAGIDLELKERAPQQLRHDVEMMHDYDLAYYHFDYPGETYWLWPLFDPRSTEPGGRNYLGYTNDGELESLFRRALDHRQFDVVKGRMNDLHRHFQEAMPFIPLWQLDTHIALHADLQTVPPPRQLDPLVVFRDLDQWKLEKHVAGR